SIVLLSGDAHVRHHHTGLPSLQGLHHVHPAELLKDAVVLLVPEAMQERTEVGPPRHLSRGDLRRTDRAEHLADGAADQLLAASGSEVRAPISLKRSQEAKA